MTSAPFAAEPGAPPPDAQGMIFDIDAFAVHDGPGVRLAVYFKGCPLRCLWCHSPESQATQPEAALARERCSGCGTCVDVCEREAHEFVAGRHLFHRERCAICGACWSSCAPGALAPRGYAVSAAEIVAKAIRHKPFFAHSGGGITLTGGETTMQPEFAEAILAGCRAGGVHTALETCGACAWETLERLARRCDLVLYDIKIVDEAAHREWTGASNRRILDNARRLAALSRNGGPAVRIRIPLIPAATDTDENIRAIFAFMRGAGLTDASLLPYNPSAGAKYEWLDREYTLQGEPQTRERLETLAALGREMGIQAASDGR